MKDIKVSELKSNLSKYLRMASRGSSILVKDRDEPLAQLGPPQVTARSWRERMARQGRLRLGSQKWSTLKLSKLAHVVHIQDALQATREDPSEVRRR